MKIFEQWKFLSHLCQPKILMNRFGQELILNKKDKKIFSAFCRLDRTIEILVLEIYKLESV